jgi:hypothetical protein
MYSNNNYTGLRCNVSGWGLNKSPLEGCSFIVISVLLQLPKRPKCPINENKKNLKLYHFTCGIWQMLEVGNIFHNLTKKIA